jgi:hypothetical protein
MMPVPTDVVFLFGGIIVDLLSDEWLGLSG